MREPGHLTIIIVLTLIALLLEGTVNQVAAGAWSQPAGHYYTKLSGIFYSADEVYNEMGVRQAQGMDDDSFDGLAGLPLRGIRIEGTAHRRQPDQRRCPGGDGHIHQTGDNRHRRRRPRGEIPAHRRSHRGVSFRYAQDSNRLQRTFRSAYGNRTRRSGIATPRGAISVSATRLCWR